MFEWSHSDNWVQVVFQIEFCYTTFNWGPDNLICVVCEHMARTSEEKTIDRLLTLYLINECYQHHRLIGLSQTKLQKLVFLSEKELIDNRVKAFNYRFIKLLHPSFSPELESDLTALVRLGYLTTPWFKRTNKMRMILEDFSEIFRRNRALLEIINNVLEKYAKIRTNQLVDQVNRMLWYIGSRQPRPIKDLKIKTPLLYPLTSEKAVATFQITDDELEDLEICLNPKISSGLDKAFDEMRRGNLLSHEEVFG